MREIKFRVWHKPTNKYVTMSQEDWSYGKRPVKYKDSGDFLAISHDGFLCHEGYGNGAANVEDSENYVVQQYTGIKDKNGVEIYEGDIVRYRQHMFNTEKTRTKEKEIGFDRFSGCFNVYETNAGQDQHEVIGNIFEGVDK